MPYCKSCGYQLGPPEEDLHDPDNLMEMLDEGVENEDAHLIVRDGDRGARFYCAETGQVTTILDHPPGEEGEGGDEPENQEAPQQRQPKPEPAEPEEVYELEEEKSAKDILTDVVTSPFLGLSEAQMSELMDWAEDYDGHLPADVLEDILGNFEGIQKQAATLARQKYEVKISRWMQEQQRGDGSPPIGITQHPNAPDRSSGGRRRQAQRRQPTGGRGQESEQAEQPSEGQAQERKQRKKRADTPQDLREERRRRRVERRNEVMDRAAMEFADKAAGQFAEEFGGMIGDARDIAYKVFMRKAEKDPDWFLEKAEEWDIDIMEIIMEPSDARKEELAEETTSPADVSGADEALNRVMEDGPSQEAQPETPNNDEPDIEDGGLLDDTRQEEPEGGRNDDTPPMEAEDVFDEHFGDVAAEGGD